MMMMKLLILRLSRCMKHKFGSELFNKRMEDLDWIMRATNTITLISKRSYYKLEPFEDMIIDSLLVIRTGLWV